MSSEKFPYNFVRFRQSPLRHNNLLPFPIRHRQGRECSRLRCYHPQWSCSVHHTGSKSRNRYCSQHCSNLKRKKSSFPFLYPFLSLVLISTLYRPIFRTQAKNPHFYVKRFWQNFPYFSYGLAHRLLGQKSYQIFVNLGKIMLRMWCKPLSHKHLRRFLRLIRVLSLYISTL